MKRCYLIDKKITFDYNKSQIKIDGKTKDLRKQCCDLLYLLIQKHDYENSYVSFKQIGDILWCESGGWDSDLKQSLKDCVTELRKALGNSKYIVNVRKKGYYLCCESLVEENSDDDFNSEAGKPSSCKACQNKSISKDTSDKKNNNEKAKTFVFNELTIDDLIAENAFACNTLEEACEILFHTRTQIFNDKQAHNKNDAYTNAYNTVLDSFTNNLDAYLPKIKELSERNDKCKIRIQNIINHQKYPVEHRFTVKWCEDTPYNQEYLSILEDIDSVKYEALHLREVFKNIHDQFVNFQVKKISIPLY